MKEFRNARIITHQLFQRFWSCGLIGGMVVAICGRNVSAQEAVNVILSKADQNGSFEEVIFAPWSGGERVADLTKAPDGIAYARTNPALASRADLFRFFPAVATERRNFLLTFKARVDTGGFQTVKASLAGRRQANSFLYAAPNGLEGLKSVNGEWETYRYLFQFPEPWDLTRSMQISFIYNDGNPGDRGYLDAVTLVQLPMLPAGETILLISVGEEIVIVFEGVLQMSDNLSDPQRWVDVDPAPMSPWLVPHEWKERFFRVRGLP